MDNTVPNHRILLVEDNDSGRQVVARLLENEGFFVEKAASAREALEAFSAGKFAALITDIDLKEDLNGFALAQIVNKLDPFLRPLLVHVLNHAGLYAYGFEKSFTPRHLRRVLEGVGLRVVAQTGILFIPGWLRMADLWCHTCAPRLTGLTGALVRPFAWLYRTAPSVRRHGYLTVCVVTKVTEPPPTRA